MALFHGGRAAMSYVNNIRMFVRVYELGSMSAAARDQRTSPAVASAPAGDAPAFLQGGPGWVIRFVPHPDILKLRNEPTRQAVPEKKPIEIASSSADHQVLFSPRPSEMIGLGRKM